MSIHTIMRCPKCRADWQYGWGTIGRLQAFLEYIKVSFIKCYNCQIAFPRHIVIEAIEELIKG